MNSGTGRRISGPDIGPNPFRAGQVYSPELLALARVNEANPQNGFQLLQRAVTEGAVRLLDRGARSRGPRCLPARIPRQIVQYWHSEDWPEDVRQAIQKVRDHNPEMGYKIFHEQAAREFVTAHFGADMSQLFDVCFHHTMKSDLFRLCYLYVYGGLYIDIDISCYGSFENIFCNNEFGCLLFYAEGQPWCIENGFIVSEPGHGLIGAVLKNLARNLMRYRSGHLFQNIWAETGPGVTTETIMSLLARHLLSGTDTASFDGFLMSRNDACAVSYCHDELHYKQSAEGNWRMAVPPEAH